MAALHFPVPPHPATSLVRFALLNRHPRSWYTPHPTTPPVKSRHIFIYICSLTQNTPKIKYYNIGIYIQILLYITNKMLYNYYI